jgi:hypothetical protein
MRDLLPKGALTLAAKDIDDLDRYFGADGKFPAIHIETGRIGL